MEGKRVVGEVGRVVSIWQCGLGKKVFLAVGKWGGGILAVRIGRLAVIGSN